MCARPALLSGFMTQEFVSLEEAEWRQETEKVKKNERTSVHPMSNLKHKPSPALDFTWLMKRNSSHIGGWRKSRV